MDKANICLRKWRRFCNVWTQFWALVRCMERRHELQRLIRWAERKQLAGPLSHYRNRLADEEQRLFDYHLRSPHRLRAARIIYFLEALVPPRPRYHARGSASRYRNQ